MNQGKNNMNQGNFLLKYFLEKVKILKINIWALHTFLFLSKKKKCRAFGSRFLAAKMQAAKRAPTNASIPSAVSR
ncbi:hypothetical protein [Aureivirga sp. CE67]|uniref:hypothetical protein n=1 Tax=Aureivirga sp. CE67 TaxID=1788983 RepID=UPI0018CA8949|nr:hypothetical protein [Aureivirga sp. CE67]